MRITNKIKMLAMLHKGAFLNTLRVWNTESEFLESGFRGLTSLRCKRIGIPFRYGFSHKAILCEGRKYFHGCAPSYFVYCESLPCEDCIFQGEVRRGLYGLELFWSTEMVTHREAMRNAEQTFGLRAKLLLEYYLDAVDYDDLMTLLDLYDDHVIEFSVSRFPVGHLSRRMIVWEVRVY